MQVQGPGRPLESRYAYGGIRLTRLNFYAPILLRRRYYHRTEYHYNGYFAAFYGPCLLVIGLSIVILTALQLTVQVDSETAARGGASAAGTGSGSGSHAVTASENTVLKSFCRFVGYSSVAISCLVAFYLWALLLAKFGREWHYAIIERVRRREEVALEQERLYGSGGKMASDTDDARRRPLHKQKSAKQ